MSELTSSDSSAPSGATAVRQPSACAAKKASTTGSCSSDGHRRARRSYTVSCTTRTAKVSRPWVSKFSR